MNTIYRLYRGTGSGSWYVSREVNGIVTETSKSTRQRPERQHYSTLTYSTLTYDATKRELHSPLFELIDTYTVPEPATITYRLLRGISDRYYVSRSLNGDHYISDSMIEEPDRTLLNVYLTPHHRPNLPGLITQRFYTVLSEQTVPAPVDSETPPTSSTPSGGHYKMQADTPVISIPIGPTDSGYRIDVQHHPAHWNIVCSLRFFEGDQGPVTNYPLLAAERDALRDALGQHSTPSAAPSTDGYRLEATAKDWFVRDGEIVIGQIPLQAGTFAPYHPELWTQHGNRAIGRYETLDQAAQALYEMAKRLT